MSDLKDASQRKLSFFATIKAVCWSFVGLRKKSSYEQDAAKLNPIYVVIAGISVAAIFIATLILIVKSVVANQ
ncbi:DUF2970 domain-containing protein [Solimicrobium silvestre]|uniref:DUF2970 domain-containing protein n=1 Tax=Solimicrobium silvestre TaxID=2099400 RepID=A0A2S9H157_9BURK|nr:DUF2970 domain-containing protein [Solimicrobium silvestre]PRC93698.1 hypothetical protein S2091_1699 [Solimicrobium silvestre]